MGTESHRLSEPDRQSSTDYDHGRDLEITVLDGDGAGIVNVHRPESDRAHSVILDGDGHAVRCSCRGWKFHGDCYHTSEIERRPLIVATARAAGEAR
jgi:hypothetical protein